MKAHITRKNTWLALYPFVLGLSVVTLSCNITSVFKPSTPTPTITPTFTGTSTVTPSPTSSETPTRTPSRTPTPEPTEVIPAGTPMSIWNNIPILSDALAGESQVEDRFYRYITHTSQDEVLDYYLEQLPHYNWDIDWVSPNDEGGYIIYRKNILDWVYIFEEGDLTFVNIFLSSGSPSLNP